MNIIDELSIAAMKAFEAMEQYWYDHRPLDTTQKMIGFNKLVDAYRKCYLDWLGQYVIDRMMKGMK